MSTYKKRLYGTRLDKIQEEMDNEVRLVEDVAKENMNSKYVEIAPIKSNTKTTTKSNSNKSSSRKTMEWRKGRDKKSQISLLPNTNPEANRFLALTVDRADGLSLIKDTTTGRTFLGANNEKKSVLDKTSITNKILGVNNTNNFNSTWNYGTSTKKDVTETTEDIAPVKTTTKREGTGTTNEEGYTYTGRNWGDYWYQAYSTNKDLKIYEKDGKYFVQYSDGKYQNVDNISFMTTKEANTKALEEAKKLGYKANTSNLSISNQIKLDTANLTSEEQQEYTEDLIRQQKDKLEDLERKNKVQTGINGVRGAIGNIKTATSNIIGSIDDNIVEPIANAKDSYNVGKMTEELGMEAYKKMMGKANNYDELKEEYDKFVTFNEDIVSEGNYLDQTIQTLPNQIGGLAAGIKRGGLSSAAGAILGGAVGAVTTKTPQGAAAGATTGAKWLGGAGYVTGQSDYTYKLESGLQYQTLIDMGVPEDIAKKEAQDTGVVNALIESGESILDLFTLGSVSKLKDVFTGNLIKKYGEETVSKWVGKSVVKNALSEGAEEATQEAVSIHNEKQATKQAGIERDDSQDKKRIVESAIVGTLAGGISDGGVTAATGITKTGINTIKQKNYTQNEQKVIDSLVNEQVNGIAKQNALENELNKAIESKEAEQGGILSVKEKNALKSKIQAQIDSGEIDISSTKVSNKDISKIRAAVEENMQKGLLDTNTIESVLGANTDLSNDGYLQKSYIETAKKKEAFTYENKITDAKEKAVYESAAKYFNNTTRSHEFVERVAKISKDKGTNYGFINNEELQTLGHDVEGKQVNGLVRTNKNGEQTVLINVDSPKALETIVGHETTHLLEGTQEYQDLQDAIFNYAKEKGDFDARQKGLNSLYEGIENANVDSELTADLVGDYLFADTDFINSLSTQKPTVFQKIKDLIDDLILKFTGTKEEKALREVQKKFKEAYKAQGTQTNTEVQYSINDRGAIENLNNIEGFKVEEDYAPYDDILGHTFRIKTKEGKANLVLRETNDTIYLNGIVTRNTPNQTEKGTGTKILNNLKDYADKTGKKFVLVEGVSSADGFYDKFNWLKKDNLNVYDDNGNIFETNKEKNRVYDPNVKYSLTDNQGRELTKEQQEYFKDSKVRDENGNLLTAYHGTEANAGIPKEYWFTTFDIDKSGRNGNMLGEGFYFTTSEEHAKQYAHTKGNVYEVYLDIKNPLELDYLNGGGLAYNIRKINPLIEADIYKRDGQIDGYKVRRYLLENGYDGIHVGDTWVAFNSNQIKSVENANPTAEDPNIFRSLSQQNETVSKNPNLTYSEDIKLQVEEAIAPLKEQINELTEQLANNTTDNVKVSENPNMEQIAPIQEETYLQEYLNNPTSKIIDGFDYGEHRIRIINKANNDIVNLIDKTSNENMVQVLQKAYEENEQSIGNKNPANGIYDGRHEDAVLEYQHKESMLSGFIRKLQGIYGKNNNIKDTEMYKLLKENQNTHKNLAINEFAPIPQDIVEQQNKEAFKNIDDSNMPSEVEDTTPDNEAKMTTSKSLFETRDYADVGNRKVNAYQYDNPEVKPYFQEAAQLMLYDLDNSIKGERIYNDEAYYNSNGEIGWQGTKRHTTEDIAELLDGVNGKYKLSREDIKKGLNAIINDEGAENNAASKRIEMYLDQRLRQGYTTVDGFEIPANQEYIDMMNTKTTNGEDIADYHNSIPITDDLAPVENVDNVSNSESIAPFKEKTTTENDNDVLDVPIQRKFDLENQVITDETISKLEKKKAREFKKLGAKEDYISNRALELYDEVKNLKQGTKASYELGRVLDVAFANIEEHTKGKTEAEAKKIKNAIWRRVTTSLLNVKAKPLTTVNVNSKVESAIRQNLNKEYDSKVDEINNLKEEKITRKNIHQGYIDTIKQNYAKKGFDFDKVLDNATKKSTLSSVDNTPQRFIEKTLGYKEGQILSDLTVNQTALNESEGIKWLNSFTNRKDGEIARISKQYNIKPGSKENAAAQMYGEGFYVDENNNLVKYGDAELAKDFPNRTTQENIKKLAKDPRIREIYDETLNIINESRVRNGYPEIPRRENYFLHFRAMEDTFSKIGLPFNPNDIKAKDLPTDMAAIDTASLRPGQPYFASANRRMGNKTTYDLLGGLERYLVSAKNQIYHIDDIQTLRALRNYIADRYGQAKGLEDIDSLSDAEAQERIEKVYDAHLSTFAKFLNEQANVLAGKTTLIDRGLEGIIGRRGITTLNTINSQVAKNMVGFNISSSLTNFTGAVQGFAKAENKFDAIKAFAQVTSNKINSIFGNTDGFVENDPTMIRRQGVEKFYRTPYEKVSDVGYGLMSAVDNITTEFLVRTKYNELTRKGMGDEQAHIEAGKWAMRILGDRSLGQQPQLYNSKMLGLFTKFQLEVRNQLDSMIYDTIQEANVNTEDIKNASERNAKKAAKITSTMVQLAVFQHLFGKAFESVAGYNPTFDIIETLMTALGFDDDEDSEDTPLDNIEQAFLGLLEDLPYTSTFTGGRIPIQSALPIEQFIKGEDDYGNEKSRIETFSEALPYYVLPGGYNQLKKTSQGLSMFDDDLPVSGSYTDSGNLRFPVEDTLGNRIQAGVFGQWANENAQTYFDEERQTLKEKQIQEFVDLDLPIREYWDYRDGLKGLDKLEDKFEYINDLDVTDEQKNIMINNIVDRKEKVDMSNYDDYENYEEFDFAIKNEEKYDFLQKNNISYSQYATSDESKEAYNWAFNNPENYSVSKAVTDDLVTYREYKTEISDISADKDSDGKSISGSRKEKIISYVNSLDLSIPQKAILIRQEYSTFDEYNNEIVEYVGGLDIEYEEKVTILEKLDMTVKNGRVYWK